MESPECREDFHCEVFYPADQYVDLLALSASSKAQTQGMLSNKEVEKRKLRVGFLWVRDPPGQGWLPPGSESWAVSGDANG